MSYECPELINHYHKWCSCDWNDVKFASGEWNHEFGRPNIVASCGHTIMWDSSRHHSNFRFCRYLSYNILSNGYLHRVICNVCDIIQFVARGYYIAKIVEDHTSDALDEDIPYDLRPPVVVGAKYGSRWLKKYECNSDFKCDCCSKQLFTLDFENDCSHCTPTEPIDDDEEELKDADLEHPDELDKLDEMIELSCTTPECVTIEMPSCLSTKLFLCDDDVNDLADYFQRIPEQDDPDYFRKLFDCDDCEAY